MRRSNLLPLALGPPIPRQVVLYAQPIELALGPDVDIGPDRVRVVQRGGGEVDLVGLAIRPPQELRAAIGAEAPAGDVGGLQPFRPALEELHVPGLERDPGHDRRAGAALAHAAVAVVHLCGFALAAIADSAAEAAAFARGHAVPPCSVHQTGVWSDALSLPRGSRSMSAPVSRSAACGESRR